MNRFFAAATAALALTSLVATPALARDISQNVSYANLDLGTEAGARAMLERIDDAARSVCGDTRGRISLSERTVVRACIAETKQQAVAELNNPTVTAMFEGQAPAVIIAQR